MMKKSLLELVKDILSDLDSEDVNGISETVEAQQVASILQQTFYDIIANENIPEHNGLLKLTALADSSFPTHFSYPSSVKEITTVWYDTSSTGIFSYREVNWVDPMEFLRRTDGTQGTYTNVVDKSGGTNLRIVSDKQPDFYTSFDNEYLVFNSFDSTIDATLQQSKVRAYGTTLPSFSMSDDYVPDLDLNMFPYLVQEAKSRAFSVLKGSIDQKIEQAARRQKVGVQNNKYKTVRGAKRYAYGRNV